MNYFMQHKEAFIGTIIFIVAIILFLVCCGLTMPDPPYVEESILLDFSTTVTETPMENESKGGSGNPDAGASKAESKVSPSKSSPSQSSTTSNSSSAEQIETQANEEAATVPSGSSNNNDNKAEETPQVSQTNNKVDFSNLSGSTNLNGGSSAQNNNPSGPKSKDQGPAGSGYGNLNSGKLLQKIEPVGKDNLTGTVKLEITVNKSGNVETVKVIQSNCSECTPLAIEAVKKWKYAPGNVNLKGQVTVEFKLKEATK